MLSRSIEECLSDPLPLNQSAQTPAGDDTYSDSLPNVTTLNGLMTSHGLIVSAIYELKGERVVDIFEEEREHVTNMPVSELGLEVQDIAKAKTLMVDQRRQVPGWKLQATFRNAFDVLASRPALGQEMCGKMVWTTWGALGQRSTNLARYLKSILPTSSCVCLCARNSIDWIVALLAIVLAEFVAVPVHFLAQSSFRAAVIAEAAVQAAFVDMPGDWQSLEILEINSIGEMEAKGAALKKIDDKQATSLADLKRDLERFLKSERNAAVLSKERLDAIGNEIRTLLANIDWDDDLGQLVVRMARQVNDLSWLSLLERPGNVGSLTLRELADSWMLDARNRIEWEMFGRKFGSVWLTSVLEALIRHQCAEAVLVEYALTLSVQQDVLDPWTVDLVCRFAASLPYTEQETWYALADKVAPAKVGSSYEVLKSTPLRRNAESEEFFFELAEGSVVEVLQVDVNRVHVACDIAQGWIDLWDSDGAAIINETVPEPLAMILYTSGSTGTPKGALIKNRTMNKHLCDKLGFNSDFSGVHLLGAPLSTSSAPYNIFGNILAGGRTAILQEGGQTFEFAPSVGPTMLGGVPQMWMLLYKRFQDGLTACKNEADVENLRREAAGWLGPRIRSINCGGALPCPAVMLWLRSTFAPADVTENYGITEAGRITGGATGQLQPIKEGTQVRLEDFGVYRSTDVPPRGEICVKTGRMAAGYLNRPDLTNEAFTADGFFRTGDIGEMPDPHHLRVIDRKKAFFKLSNGEWVSPESVESILSEVPEVRQVLVYGDSSHEHVVAVTVASKPAEYVLHAFQDIMKLQSDVRHFEIPTAVHVSSEAWKVENGMLTSTGKICRRKILERFANQIQEMLEASGHSEQAENEILRLLHHGTDEISWQALDLNSITAVRATHAIRNALGVDVPVIHLLRKAPLAAIKAHIEGKKELSMSIDRQSVALGSFEPKSGDRAPKVLLTGATGHVGACVLQLLAETTDFPVTALVRGASDAAARERLHETLRRRGYTKAADDVQADRVQVIRGDLREENLGLPQVKLDSLAGGVVLHVAAEVHHLQSYEALEAANVSGVRNLLTLATLEPTKFVFISTMSANRSSKSGYGQSKQAGEDLVREALARGMHGSVLRLGMVGPDRITGACNVQDWLIRYILGAIQIGAWYGPGSLRLYPCENVAKAIVSRIDDDTCLPDPCILPSGELMAWVAASGALHGRRMRQVSLKEWQELLADLPESNPMFPLRHYYHSKGLGQELPEGSWGYDPGSIDRMMIFLDREGLLPKLMLKRTLSNNSKSAHLSTVSLHRSISQGSASSGIICRSSSQSSAYSFNPCPNPRRD